MGSAKSPTRCFHVAVLVMLGLSACGGVAESDDLALTGGSELGELSDDAIAELFDDWETGASAPEGDRRPARGCDCRGQHGRAHDRCGSCCAPTVPDAGIVEALERAVRLLQNHQLLVQNDDGGWDFFVEDSDALRDTANASPPNTFGAPALGVLDAYSVTLEPEALSAARTTAEVLLTRPIGRKDRLFAADSVFLLAGSTQLGFARYAEAAALSHAAEKDYAAALFVLADPDPSSADVDAIAQADLDAVSPAERVEAFHGRLVWAGRGAGLRIYDWGYRLQLARALGDRPYARAILARIAADYAELSVDKPLYLLGLAWSVIAVHSAGRPAYGLLAGDARRRLLAQQQDDGLFRVPADEGSFGGSIQEQAFVARALVALRELGALRRQLEGLLAAQLPSGAFEELGGGENVFGQGELLSSLAPILGDEQLLVALAGTSRSTCGVDRRRHERARSSGRDHRRPTARCFR